MIEVDAKALAIEADKTLVLDIEEVVDLANKNDIAVIAI
jgi:DUF1009 family protein